MRMRGSRFFQFSKICLHFPLFVYNFLDKLPRLNRILALPTFLQCCIHFLLNVLKTTHFSQYKTQKRLTNMMKLLSGIL